MAQRLIRTIIVAGLCIIAGAGRGGAPAGAGERPPIKSEAAAFQIGLIPERNIFKQIERYRPIADYLSAQIGLPVKLRILTQYGNIIDNFISLGLDAAFFGSFTYALAHAEIGVQAIVRPEDHMGISCYHGLIFTRKDSGISGIVDMKGKTFAFVDRATTAGYLLPLAYFKENGVRDYQTFFKETYYTGTHEDVIRDVLNQKADIGAAKNTVFFSMAEKDSRITTELTVLKRSPDVPENGLAVRKDLDSALKARIKQVLLAMHTDPVGVKVLKSFGARGFIETTDRDYINVLQYVQQSGLDISAYRSSGDR
ncbi:MAG: phosphate/phosphite/phosphonate ABC transporter substrate-binding protein [Thermodesulfobacteriota bacterium]